MPVARRGTPPTSQIKEHKSVLTSLSAWTDNGEEDEQKDKKTKFTEAYAQLLPQNEGPPTLKQQFFATLQVCTDVESDRFNMVVGMVIIANACTIGLETEYGDTNFRVFEHLFNAVFFTEMLLRIRALGRDYFKEAWNLFDFTLVCFGTVDLWILPVLTAGGESSVFHGASSMRMLRTVRLFRVLRVVRLFRMFMQLHLIMQAFNKAFQIVLLMGLLVLILDYVCAIMLTQAIGHNAELWEDSHDEAKIKMWFGGISQSMQTLFMIMTLTGWDEISYILVKVVPSFAVYATVALYIMVTSYTMLSLVTGIISESLITAQQEYRMRKEQNNAEKKKEVQKDLLNELLDLFDEDTKDRYNHVNAEELKMGVKGDTDLLMKLANLGVHIDEGGILNLIDKLSDEKTQKCNIDYFVDKLTNLTGAATASSIMDLKYEVSKVHMKMDAIQEKLGGHK